MDPPRPSALPVWLAPGAGSAAVEAPSHAPRLPPIDRHLLREDSGAEVVDGRVVQTMGAEEPHATLHFDVPRLLGHCLAGGYVGAADLLTRPTEDDNFAPDISIYPEARDPATGGRQVEDLAFEIIDTTPLARVTTKARKLVTRGVRRVFVIDVADRAVREWSRARDDWELLPPDAAITDRCFSEPVPVRALVDHLLADEVVVRALHRRRNPALMRLLDEREARGRDEGLAPLVRQFERRLGRALTADERATLRARLATHGPERLGDVVLDLAPDALAAWLADIDAR